MITISIPPRGQILDDAPISFPARPAIPERFRRGALGALKTLVRTVGASGYTDQVKGVLEATSFEALASSLNLSPSAVGNLAIGAVDILQFGSEMKNVRSNSQLVKDSRELLRLGEALNPAGLDKLKSGGLWEPILLLQLILKGNLHIGKSRPEYTAVSEFEKMFRTKLPPVFFEACASITRIAAKLTFTPGEMQFLRHTGRLAAHLNVGEFLTSRMVLPNPSAGLEKLPYLDLGSGSNFLCHLPSLNEGTSYNIVEPHPFAAEALREGGRLLDKANASVTESRIEDLILNPNTVGTIRVKQISQGIPNYTQHMLRVCEALAPNGNLICQTDPFSGVRAKFVRFERELLTTLVNLGWTVTAKVEVSPRTIGDLDTITLKKPYGSVKQDVEMEQKKLHHAFDLLLSAPALDIR